MSDSTPLPRSECFVKNPSHYQFYPGKEAIEIIASSMTQDQWFGYCMGNSLKYRLRAGKKGDGEQDLDKANFYRQLYDDYCYLTKP